jgi:DNA-directed RNA polymerase subunit RPC12/RpoP
MMAAVQRNEDMLLGKLAIRERLCTPEQIDECLRVQANSREAAPLGDILLYKGYLTEIQLKSLLSRQQKKVMACLACGLRFTVLTLSGGMSARCPKCKGPLNETPAALVRTDAEFSTRRLPVIPPPTGPTIDLVCVICDHRFKGSVDSAGRVRCPACQSSFRSGSTA